MDNGKINLTYDGRVSLSFQLAIPHAPDKVWKVITEREYLDAWFPADVDFDLTPGADLLFKVTPEQVAFRTARRSRDARDGHQRPPAPNSRIPLGRRYSALGTGTGRHRRLLADSHPHDGGRGVRVRARRRLARGLGSCCGPTRWTRSRLVSVGPRRRTLTAISQVCLILGPSSVSGPHLIPLYAGNA